MRTGVDVCDCTPGCADTVRESALKVDSEIKVETVVAWSELRNLSQSDSHIPCCLTFCVSIRK